MYDTDVCEVNGCDNSKSFIPDRDEFGNIMGLVLQYEWKRANAPFWMWCQAHVDKHYEGMGSK